MDPLLSLNDNLESEEQRRQIDEALEKIQLNALALKSRRNTLSLLYRLPPEIICAIFRCVNGACNMKVSQWIGVTHISRHLRNIAVNSPSLWVNLPVRNLPWTEEMLKRSKSAGLVLKFTLLSRKFPPGLLLALQHVAQTKVLSITKATSPEAWKQLLQYMPKSAPQLQSLIIEFPDVGRNTPPLPTRIPEDILCETKQLRRLELTRCDFSWTSQSHLLHSLTHLQIDGLSKQYKPTAQQFTDALRGMPNLVSLCLVNALPVQIGLRPSLTSDNIHFPLLRYLKMDSMVAELEAFFSCVTFPPTATVHVHISSPFIPMPQTKTKTKAKLTADRSAKATDFSGLISGLARSYSSLSSEEAFQTIVLERTDSPDAVQVDLRSCISKNGHFPAKTPRLRLVFRAASHRHLDLNPREGRSIITNIFRSAIPLQNIKQIYLPNAIPGYDAEMISSTIGSLPEVEFVRAADEACGPFLKGLKPGLRAEGSTLPFPHLTWFCLHLLQFKGSTAYDFDPSGPSVGALRKCLVHRRKSGAAIAKLGLKCCRGISQQDVNSLSQVVGKVDWDGQQVLDSDDDDNFDDDAASKSSGSELNSSGGSELSVDRGSSATRSASSGDWDSDY